MAYRYGMRLRGFSPGCQPKEGFLERLDDESGRYHDIIVYDRELSVEEVRNYELDPLDVKNPVKDLRDITGLTQTQFGNKYHIPLRTVQHWENGTRKPSETILYLLSRAVHEDYK